jgi:hypothetical protein
MILPDELAWKEKKAAQYSSGIYLAIEKLARKNGCGRGVRNYLVDLMGKNEDMGLNEK